MKAMVLTGIRQMEMRDVPDPRIVNPTDVLIKMAAVGVCGSDVHYYVDGRIGSQVVKYPFAVGHEGAGVVEAVGGAVTRVKPGDRIAVEPAMWCGSCDQCLIGRQHTCRNLKFLGCPGQAAGCLSEFVVMPEGSCYPIRAGMSFEQAALSEPLAIGVYAVQLAGDLRDSAVGVLGAGPIGLSVMLAARLQSVRKCYVTDLIDDRLGLAQTLGADWVANPRQWDVPIQVAKCEPLLLDVVFECCGQQEALDQAVAMLKPGGTLVVVGIPRADRVSFGIDSLRRKELRILNVRRQNHCVRKALELLDSRTVNADPMVTHRFPFERTPEAFDLVADYRDGVVKAMIGF